MELKTTNKMGNTKKERHIGSVRVSSDELPEIRDWTISQEYEIKLKVKMTSIEEVSKWDVDEYTNLSKDDIMARFDIVSVISPSKEAAKKQSDLEKRGRVRTPITLG